MTKMLHGGFLDGSGWEGVYNALRRANRQSLFTRQTPVAVTSPTETAIRMVAG